MIKLYDKNYNFLQVITEFKFLKIEERLDRGYKTISFKLPYNGLILHDEDKLNYNEYKYVIKELNMTDNRLYEVYAEPDFGDLKQLEVNNFITANQSLESSLFFLLKDSEWTFELKDSFTGGYDLSINNKTLLETLNLLFSLFAAEVYYDTNKKIIYIWKERGITATSQFIISGLNLSSCKIESNSHNLITRLIPIGKNNLDISAVNGGTRYVEDFSYTNNIILGYYINSDIKTPIDLLTIGKEKIKELSQPQINYTIKINALPVQLNIGDKIRIIDNVKNVDTVQRVRTIVHYPFNPSKDTIEIGSPKVNFSNIYKDFTNAQKALNNNTLISLSLIN